MWLAEKENSKRKEGLITVSHSRNHFWEHVRLKSFRCSDRRLNDEWMLESSLNNSVHSATDLRLTTGNRRPTDLRQSPTGDTHCSTRGRWWAASAGWSACAGTERSRCSRFWSPPYGRWRSRGLRSDPEKLSDSEAVAGNLKRQTCFIHSCGAVLKIELKSLKKIKLDSYCCPSRIWWVGGDQRGAGRGESMIVLPVRWLDSFSLWTTAVTLRETQQNHSDVLLW